MGLEKDSETSDEDKRLEEELLQLVDVLTGPDEKEWPETLTRLQLLMKTSTTSMTSVPKPLKYLRTSYGVLKAAYARTKDLLLQLEFADILSVLAMAGAKPESRECLAYCLQGTMENPGGWGHEYVRQLETEIVEEWTHPPVRNHEIIKNKMIPLVKKIIEFDMKHNAEIQACDLCLEIDRLPVLNEHLDSTNFKKVCLYLTSCAAYSDEEDRHQILRVTASYYLRFAEYSQAMLVALQLGDDDLISTCLQTCPDAMTRKQLAFLLSGQQGYPLTREYQAEDVKDIEIILGNGHVSGHFHTLARELDILEPNLPEDIYKSWLTSTSAFRPNDHDSARANLASSFVTGFVHAGFGADKLMANTEDCWLYKNKDHGMLSATASLGLIHLWDADGGLVPIDKYLYTTEDMIRAGALLAIGLVNCGVRHECDPALALLTEYVTKQSQILRVGSILGLGLAYAGSRREDVSEILCGALNDDQSNMEVVSIASIALGLVNVGSGDAKTSSAILQKLLESSPFDLTTSHARFIPLALGLVYMGCRDAIEAPSAALGVLHDPLNLEAETMLEICAYAGTGNVLIVQGLLKSCSEPVEIETQDDSPSTLTTSSSYNSSFFSFGGQKSPDKRKARSPSSGSSRDEQIIKNNGARQALATLGVAIVGLGEEKECSRIFTQIGRYGSAPARRAVPLALALTYLSNPDPIIVDVLNKYSHDGDADVAYSAIFSLGLVGAGTNNARLATMLRHLAAYHAKNASNLFLIRLAQGLVHLGKGTMSLSPLRYSGRILDKTALAGLLVVLVSFLDCRNLVLGKSHYLLYCLATAMRPRWLVTLDEDLKPLPVSVRVGQAVDAVAKAGSPKTVVGGHVHTTPILLTFGEKAELVGDDHEPLSEPLEGFVILRKK